MDTKGAESSKMGKLKDAILAEIFNAYKESGTLYQKTTDPEIRRTMQDLKRCYDLAILRLSPLGVRAEKRWDEMKAPFSSQSTTHDHNRTTGAGAQPRLED